MNFVMTAGRKMVEVQPPPNTAPDDHQFTQMLALARKGVDALIAKQQAVLSTLTLRQ
jgi:ribonuclease PH